MKTLNFWILLLAVFSMASLTACNDNSSKAEKAAEDIGQAAEEVADVFRSDQEELRADIKETQRDIERKVEDLEAQLNTASDEAAGEINQQINQLKAWNNELSQDLNRIGETAEGNWQKVKADIRNSLNDIEQQWNETFES